jgi:hypothetical protein
VSQSRFEEDIQSEYEDITEADEQDFDYRRFVLENTLDIGTEGRGQIRQNLSPRNPAESRQNLSTQFANKIRESRGGIEEIREDIEKVRNRIEYTMMLNQVPDNPNPTPEAISNDLDTCEDLIDQISQAITDLNIRDAISLPDDEEKSEEFPNTDDELTLPIGENNIPIGSKLSDIRKQVGEALTEVKRWQSIGDVPADLQYIHTELSSRQTRDIEDLLTTIGDQKNKGTEELNIKEFFEDIQTLFENNHISIEIASEHRQT